MFYIFRYLLIFIMRSENAVTKIPLCFRRGLWHKFPFSDIIAQDNLQGRKIKIKIAISLASLTFYWILLLWKVC